MASVSEDHDRAPMGDAGFPRLAVRQSGAPWSGAPSDENGKQRHTGLRTTRAPTASRASVAHQLAQMLATLLGVQ